jgi:hypothetical protein
MSEQASLFADLPEQLAPVFRETDEHLIEPCSRCGGAGREENPFPRWSALHGLWDPICRKCRGSGRILTHIGRAIDV